jgi:ketosteroid isomerase-like protein
MKKCILICLVSSFWLYAKAQNADALISAERDFERACIRHGIRDGFLAFVDSSGIIFTGKGPVNGKLFWTSLPVSNGVFSWTPSYAEMSLSGDWGYTTGNYEHRAKSLDDSVEQSGQYTTVWHKTDAGEWKYLVDIGNVHAPIPLEREGKIISVKKYKASHEKKSPGLAGQEDQFILFFEKNIRNAYQKYAGSKYILNLSGHLPVFSADSAFLRISGLRPVIIYHPSGVFVSKGNDMGAVYGTFTQDHKKGNYLRIWRHEKHGWKIALEVIKQDL